MLPGLHSHLCIAKTPYVKSHRVFKHIGLIDC